MVGRRTYQRGHATAPFLQTGFERRPRRRSRLALALLAGLVMATLGAAAWWQQRDQGPELPSDTPVEGKPSLLNTALAKVQESAHDLVLPRAGSGLELRPLSEPAIKDVLPRMGAAEARLLDIYRLISQGQHRQALALADALVVDHPNFHLAHLVRGDLLSVQMRPVGQLGDVPDTKASAAQEQLQILREESRRRLRALTERPPEGHVPTQFLSLSTSSRHAIAIDASRSRLYLFENLTPANAGDTLATVPQLRLLGDYYISVGLQGTEKQAEGDKRTPLGVYYITSSLNPKSLPDLYGVGALPINYPNALDLQRGKTGSGIWLHGTPREQFVRAPQASDGCVVLSNPDLERLLATVQIRTTPVVIAPELHWVRPDALETERRQFEATLQAWREVKSRGDLERLHSFYSSRFQSQGRDLAQWWPKVEGEMRATRGGEGLELKDLSLLQWRDKEETMVVTFGEVARGQSRGQTKRQYWARENDQWKIFFEGTP